MRFFELILAIFALAMLAPVLHALAGRATGLLFSILPLAIAFYALSFLSRVAAGEVFVVTYPWAASLDISLSYSLDGLSLLFVLLISFIGAIVLIYTSGYFHEKPELGRFYFFFLSFMGSMLGLVLADNIIALFVFWELTSLTSYFLIGFEHEREGARAAALQALLVTSGGGLALLAGFLLLGQAAGSFDLSEILRHGEAIRTHPLITAMMVLMLLGAFTKSAQVPFHFWLPNAMEAPTPVSAYLHSATMVKAGIYLLARLSPVFAGTWLWQVVVSTAGALTMLVAAILAFRERDLKRILAYSTVSALGLLTFLLGIGTKEAIVAMLVFLLGHALYKGALFLIAGGVDDEAGTRDVSRLGALSRSMPFTAAAACLAGLSMAGLPPFFGYVGKETIYQALLDLNALWLPLVAAVITNVLFFALAGILVIGPFFGNRAPQGKIHEAPVTMWSGPLLLGTIGLTVAFVPAVEQFMAAAAAAVVRRVEPVDLGIWHGMTPELLLSGITFGFGAAVYAFRAQLPIDSRLLAGRYGPEAWYEWLLQALNAAARVQTRFLQSGYLRYYLLIIILTLVALAGAKLEEQLAVIKIAPVDAPHFYEAVVAILIFFAALAVVLTESRLAAIAALGVVGYGVAMIYVLFGAPDLAMTQFMIETLSVILFVLVFYHLPRSVSLSKRRERVRDAIVACASGTVITGLVLLATQISLYPKISGYFAEQSFAAAHGRNIVNVILVDFRGFDTLGEITVLALAAIGVFALLKLTPGKKEKA